LEDFSRWLQKKQKNREFWQLFLAAERERGFTRLQKNGQNRPFRSAENTESLIFRFQTALTQVTKKYTF
jgi:hypothetical protein